MFKIPPLTSDIVVASFDAASSPSIRFNLSRKYKGSHSHGWGFGWYPGDQQSAIVVKDPAARDSEILTNAIAGWANFRSNVFFCKVRGADDGYSHTETQPFSRSFAAREWLYMHNGDLDRAALEELHGRQRRVLEPLGRTDSELAFCNILEQMQESGARRLSDVDPLRLISWFRRLDHLGSADMAITDGLSIACFQGTQSPKQLHYSRLLPPDNQDVYKSDAVEVAINDPRDTFRTALIVSSSPFTTGEWTPMLPGQLIIVRRSAVTWNSLLSPDAPGPRVFPSMQPQAQQQTAAASPLLADQAATQQSAQAPSGPAPRVLVTSVRSMTQTPEGKSLAYRTFEVTHTTNYEYSEPVEHSTHVYRLQPTEDPIQQIVFSSLAISSHGEEIQFEDVFGNQSVHCTIDKPYQTLSVSARSRVQIFEAPPDDHSLSRRQTTIPLVWMPWQRQMMMPYLLPPELPEPQLRELTEYAMSFVERNDYHLVRTIRDINLSIYQDYKYVPGSTSLATTPFEVYATRQGVCQDFANLFICLTRLLSIPARYRMGYIYTGGDYENKIQSDASHAWAEVYLPYVGWRGYDPTNGCAVAQDHIRIACGRNYIDATPTSGTIYKGGGTETLTVEVKVKELIE